MLSNLATVVLLLVIFKVNRAAWRGVMAEERTPVVPGDLIAAAVLFTAGAGVAVASVLLFWQTAPLWLWPIIAMSADGLVLAAARSALGLPALRSVVTATASRAKTSETGLENEMSNARKGALK